MSVFISYSSRDSGVARTVVAALEGRGIGCWIAPRNIPAGTPYADAIVDGLRASRVLLVIVSLQSIRSPQVVREIERGVHYRIPLLPLRIDNVSLEGSFEFFLSVAHWLDATERPIEAYQAQLVDAVSALLGETRVPSTGPVDSMPDASPAITEISPDLWSRRPGGRFRQFFHSFLEDPNS